MGQGAVGGQAISAANRLGAPGPRGGRAGGPLGAKSFQGNPRIWAGCSGGRWHGRARGDSNVRLTLLQAMGARSWGETRRQE